jgi:hypothetical protein
VRGAPGGGACCRAVLRARCCCWGAAARPAAALSGAQGPGRPVVQVHAGGGPHAASCCLPPPQASLEAGTDASELIRAALSARRAAPAGTC